MRVLLATDGLPHSEAAVRALRSLPLPEATEVLIMTVVPPGTLPGPADRALLEYTARLLLDGESCKLSTCVRSGGVADEICAVALERQVDLIVLGWRRKAGRGLLENLFGGTARWVMKRAPCSVMVVKQGRRWWEETEGARPCPSAHVTSRVGSVEGPLELVLLASDGGVSPARFDWQDCDAGLTSTTRDEGRRRASPERR